MAAHRNIERSVALASTFVRPAIRASVGSLEAYFASAPESPPGLKSPHSWAAPADGAPLRRAAVLIPVVDDAHGPSLLLTRRTSHLRHHPGQMSFPGGAVDPGDASPRAAALRETHEEIGLAPDRVRVVGRLGDLRTDTFRITPFVGLVERPLELVPNPHEVASVHEIPLEHVTRSTSYQRRRMRDSDEERWFYCLEYGDVYVGGPTVAILMGLYEALLESHAPES